MTIVERAKRICLAPDAEWAVIASERATLGTLIPGYVLPLAALSAVGSSIVTLVAGLGIGLAIRGAVTDLIVAVVGVVVLATIIDSLAPTFGAVKSSEGAAKVAAYAPTPAWIAGIFQIIPFIGGLIALIGAVYSLYLLYLGLMRVMKSAADRAVGYTVVVVVVAIVVGFVVSYIMALIGVGPAIRFSY
jgi:hypothetical protein